MTHTEKITATNDMPNKTVHLNKTFRIPLQELETRVGVSLNGHSHEYDCIVPLRDIVTIDDIRLFKTDALRRLLRGIPLRNAPLQPYADAHIGAYCIDPASVMVGQTFALEEKLLDVIGKLARTLDGYATRGIAKMPPAYVYGTTADGTRALAFYMPPIVERHDNRDMLIDGLHRSYIAYAAGTTISAIRVSGVAVPPPFTPITWRDVTMAKTRPPVHERYKNLDISLFRDLGSVGIDG